MKKIIYISIILLLYKNTYSQTNLVPNPSFENTSSVPTVAYQIDNAVGWSSYKATPDLYSVLAPSWSSVLLPSNLANDAGFQYPFHGNNHALFLAYSLTSSEKREYIGTTLTSALEIGETYYVSFYVSLVAIDSALGYTGATDNIGVLFTNNQYSFSNPLEPQNNSHIHSSSIIADTTGWVKIQGSFVADSSYQYIVIGNFYDDANTTFVKYFPASPYDAAFYFLDSIFVVKTSSNSIEAITQNDFQINNGNDFLTFYSPIKDGVITYKIFDVSGKLIDECNFISTSIYFTANLSNGIYLIQLISERGIINKKIIVYH